VLKINFEAVLGHSYVYPSLAVNSHLLSTSLYAYFIISSYMFVCLCFFPFVLGTFCHLFNKRILDWIGLDYTMPEKLQSWFLE